MSNWDSASPLDRVEAERKSEEWVAGQWAADSSRLLDIDDRSAFPTLAGGERLDLVPTSGSYDSQRHFLLGRADGIAYFAAFGADPAPADGSHGTDGWGRHQPDPQSARHTVREVGQLLGDLEREIATTAAAITNWHAAEPFCPRCGRPTEIRQGGSARFCTFEERELFPRTDPAIIVAITDPSDRLLLAGQVVWGPRRVSVLAGFNEAGESLEQTVHREVAEESGIRLGEVRYFGSQPWPMPRSLMLGFSAEAISTEISVDGTEIAHADWYTRERVRDETERGELVLPGASSIAHRLITAWLEKRLR